MVSSDEKSIASRRDDDDEVIREEECNRGKAKLTKAVGLLETRLCLSDPILFALVIRETIDLPSSEIS